MLLLTFISTNSTSVMLNLHTPNTPYIFWDMYYIHIYDVIVRTALVNRNRYNSDLTILTFSDKQSEAKTYSSGISALGGSSMKHMCENCSHSSAWSSYQKRH